MGSNEKRVEGTSGANKTLIILTKTFPFDTGEEFLESEIFADAEAFEQVIIFATATRKDSVITRKLPENALACGIHESASPYARYLKYTVSGTLRIFWEPLKSELASVKGIRRIVGTLYVYGRARRNWKKILMLPDIRAVNRGNVFLYSYWCSDLALTASLLKQSLGAECDVKAFSRAHRYDLYENLNVTGAIPFREFVFSNLDAVFPCSHDGTLYLKRKYPDYADKIQTAYLGTKDHGMAPEKRENGRFHLVTCSSIIPVKRVALVAEAVAELEKQGVFVDWTCIGDGPLLNQVKEYTERNIRRSKATFMGRMENSAILEYYRNNHVDLFVNVSTSEGLPVSIMEAISFGIPVLATDVGGVAEIIKDGVTGRIMPADIDGKRLVERLMEMMSETYDRASVRAFWKERFYAEANYKKFTDSVKRL